jgi:hypothetical protein
MVTAKLEIGALVTVRGVLCRVFKIHPLGTIDVVALDSDGPAFRVSGLSFTRVQS